MLNLRMPLRHRINARWSQFLDLLASPVLSRLTDEEFYTSRTRRDCLRAYLRRRFA